MKWAAVAGGGGRFHRALSLSLFSHLYYFFSTTAANNNNNRLILMKWTQESSRFYIIFIDNK